MFCKKCGTNISNDAQFCPKCGSNASSTTAFKSQTNSEQFCNSCGARIEPYSSFCGMCGAKTNVNNSNYNMQSQSRRENNSGNLVLYIIILCLVVLICAGVVLFVVKAPSQNNASVAVTQPPVETATTEATENTQSGDIYIIQQTPAPTQTPVTYSVPYNNNYDSSYIYPTDIRYITDSDLDVFSKDQIALIRNEIYARHGYVFQTEPFKSYFSKKSWYIQNPNFNESQFSNIEKANKITIVNYEKNHGWR